jgi:hypothetical protein
VYKFEVHTNFNIVSLKKIEHKIADANDQNPIYRKQRHEALGG